MCECWKEACVISTEGVHAISTESPIALLSGWQDWLLTDLIWDTLQFFLTYGNAISSLYLLESN